MATESGTATNYLDLLSKLRTFLTTDSVLVAASQNWTELATNGTPYNAQPGANDTVDFETYLRAPGLSGTEAIYINLRAFHYGSGDYYNWEARGAQGYNAANAFIGQPGMSPPAYLFLWNQPIPYWFIANGQRVIVIAKTSTVYESMYLGKFLPYGTPGQYPYALAIGGCGSTNADLRYSDTTFAHCAFFDPVGLHVCLPDNSWLTFRNWDPSGPQQVANTVWPWTWGAAGVVPNFFGTNLDGTYAVFPARLEQSTPSPNLLGELDGVGFVTGNANSSESTIAIGSDSWMAVQNTFRTAANFFAAVKMA